MILRLMEVAKQSFNISIFEDINKIMINCTIVLWQC